MILRHHAALALTGIPELHARAFQTVADQWRTVILCRAVGVFATGLIEEGYASKGFHNKAKSCNWGPMAGFVLDDPRFTKVGGTVAKQEGQRGDLQYAIAHGAMEVPLFISEKRRQWLLRRGLISNMFGDVTRFTSTIFIRSVAPNFEIPLRLDFRLKRARPEGRNKTCGRLHTGRKIARVRAQRRCRIRMAGRRSSRCVIRVARLLQPITARRRLVITIFLACGHDG